MKRVLSIAFSSLIALALVGCHAEAGVDSDADHGEYHAKKTTTYDNGAKTTTETKTETTR